MRRWVVRKLCRVDTVRTILRLPWGLGSTPALVAPPISSASWRGGSEARDVELTDPTLISPCGSEGCFSGGEEAGRAGSQHRAARILRSLSELRSIGLLR